MSREEKKNILLYSFSGLMLLGLIGLHKAKNVQRQVKEVVIHIEQEDGNFFTDRMEVRDLLTLDDSDYVVGASLTELDPKSLEARVKKNPFVADAQVYRDLKGIVQVQVTQRRPIARIMHPDEDKYIDTNGNILPVNAKHTARVPLIEFESPLSWEESLNETTYGRQLHALLAHIDGDDFWRAQVAQLIVKKDGDVSLLPQVTKQRVELGRPENLDKKFKKLMIFYKEILPVKGWNTYTSVSLQYENQIICN